MGIVDSFGSIIMVDKITQKMYRILFSIICVSVKINTILPSFITLQSKFKTQEQHLKYQNATNFFRSIEKMAILVTFVDSVKPKNQLQLIKRKIKKQRGEIKNCKHLRQWKKNLVQARKIIYMISLLQPLRSDKISFWKMYTRRG